MKWVLALAALGALLFLVLPACSSRTPTLEEQARAIESRLMCPTCPAQTLDQSDVPLAREMRREIRARLAAGQTPEEIIAYFSSPERYGPSVLAEPPRRGFFLTAWVVPGVAVALGAVALVLVVRAMRRRTPSAGEPAPEGGLEPYLARVDQEVWGKAPRPQGGPEA